MDSWIKDKIWGIIAPVLIIVIAVIVGFAFNILTGTKEWDDLLFVLFHGVIKLIEACSLL